MSANSFLNKGGSLRWLFNLLGVRPGATSETWFNNVQLWFDEIKNIFLSFFLFQVYYILSLPILLVHYVYYIYTVIDMGILVF